MTGLILIPAYLAVVTAVAMPLGRYLAAVYTGTNRLSERWLGWLERGIYRVLRVDPQVEHSWKAYAGALLAFNAVGFVVLYLLLRLQGSLPLNPQALAGVPPWIAFNTAVSFVTNTNWQAYGGEATLSYLSQMAGLSVQNFASAAVGMAAAAALIRGIARRTTDRLGNFWVDLVRSTLYVLLPIALVLAVFFISQGVIQNLSPYVEVTTLEGAAQVIPGGPAASQIAIKDLGTNGGGFFNANSAHPFENPTPLTNAVIVVAMLAISAAFVFAYGRMIGRPKEGYAIYAAMTVIFVVLTVGAVVNEVGSAGAADGSGADTKVSLENAGGNMEGKETRFGPAESGIYASVTTSLSNGSVNAAHDSFTPLGGAVPMVNMMLGEVVFGGVGVGLNGMLVFVILTVFIAGLMVGRTPEWLGKKIEAGDVKLAVIATIAPQVAVLVLSGIAAGTALGRAGIYNPGPHGWSEILYGYASGANNNGSAFGGLGSGQAFYTLTVGLAMIVGRFLTLVPVLALAGRLGNRKASEAVTEATFRTSGPLFVVLLLAVVVIVGALTYLPALAVGPIVESLGA
ncbi:MAG TPA: potassium-transporting ATPase subunit KdpA [Acidimicrobiia bacterium]|nr:potassium-transporting ATPase subunit KdpA [Acidimicrobiia bacterium]